MTRRLTTCPYCGVGCGVEAEVEGDRLIAVMGDGRHPANAGRLCVKGTALAETLGHEGRLLHPRLQGRRVSWDGALDTLSERLRVTRERYGPQSVAFYLSGQLLTEDYYVANKLMKGFLGSANVDTNSRLCMSSAVAAHKRAFGEDVVPCSYEDLETCDLLVLVGSNAAWTHPVIYQRIQAARAHRGGPRLVVIDPRRTATCEDADLHLQLRPGTDAFLFGGLLRYLAAEGLTDEGFVRECTGGLDASLAAVAELDPCTVQEATGLAAADLQRFYHWFGDTPRAVTLFSQGINQSVSGTDKGNAIINCHLATGRIGQPGVGPFSITGQPNAMGGREVGGLANQLAAHMDFNPADMDRVQRFWRAADLAAGPGLKAVDMFRAAEAGEIRFLWIMATNPAVSLPDSAAVRRALERCDFVVVSDCSGDTDTARMADLLLPAAAWGEKDGTVTNSERVISRQRQLVPAPGEARPDWWIVTEVARRLGLGAAFDYRSPADIFREHAALSGFENDGDRAFDIGALAQLDDAGYETLAPVRWPLEDTLPAPFTDRRFFTPDGRARFVPVRATPPAADGKLLVNSGRLRDQWHTMTRTGRVPRLARHRDFFAIEVNPATARAHGLRAGDLARLGNERGAVHGLVLPDEGLPPGQAFLPIHWSDQFAAQAAACALFPAITDPVSGQPQLKLAGAELSALPVGAWGLLFSRRAVSLPDLAYWSQIAVDGGSLTLLGHGADPAATRQWLEPLLVPEDGDLLSFEDDARGDYRLVWRDGDSVARALFLGPGRDALPGLEWMAGLAGNRTGAGDLLAGIDLQREDPGTLICSCWEVGERQVSAAIEQGAGSVEDLGTRLRCGTGCGSCVPELKQLLALRRRDCAA